MLPKNTLSLSRFARRSALAALLVLALSSVAPQAAQASPMVEGHAAGSALIAAWEGFWSNLGTGFRTTFAGWLGGGETAGQAGQALDGRWEHHGVGMDPDGEPAPSGADGDHGVGMDPHGMT